MVVTKFFNLKQLKAIHDLFAFELDIRVYWIFKWLYFFIEFHVFPFGLSWYFKNNSDDY